MKKALVLILAALMLISVAACSSGTDSSKSTTAPKSDATTQASSTAAASNEPVELNLITIFASDDPLLYDSPVYEEFTKQSGVKLTSTWVDRTKFDLIIASGDTTDLIACTYADYYKTLATGGLIVKLNDMIDKLGKNLKKPEKDIMWTLLKDTYDNGDGSIYGVLNSIGMQGGNARPTNLGTYTLWDYYKEIGAPELEDFSDFVDALEQIVKKHPTTADGKPIYAFSFYNQGNELAPFYGPFLSMGPGYREYNPYIATRFEDNTLCYIFLDEEGPYWQAAKYMNDAYNRGLVDPDSFIQTRDDFKTKRQNGQLLNDFYVDSKLGWEIIPMSGTWMQENLFDIGGNVISIASTCKNKEAAFKLLDYLHGTEAARLIYSGVEGIHWNYDENGIPCWTDETIKLLQEGGDPWSATGVDHPILYSIVGVARGEKCEDGTITSLERTQSYFLAGLNDNGKDFCEFYSKRDGADYKYPNQVLYARGVKDGRDLNSALTKSYGTPPDDIARIDAALLEIAKNAVPRLVMAAPGQYESVKASVMKELQDAGVQKSYDWWQNKWQTLADKFLK